MSKLLKIGLVIACLAIPLSAQLNITQATSELDSVLNTMSKILAEGISEALPMAASAGAFSPIDYGLKKKGFNMYFRLPLSVNLGKVDIDEINEFTKDLDPTLTSGGAIGEFTSDEGLWFPLPLITIETRFRLKTIPIVKRFDFGFRYRFIPNIANIDAISESAGPVSINELWVQGFSVDTRFRILDFKLFKLAASGGFNFLRGKTDFSYSTTQDLTQSATATITSTIGNDFTTTSLSANLLAEFGFRFFKLYAGAGALLTTSYKNDANYSINGSFAGTTSDWNLYNHQWHCKYRRNSFFTCSCLWYKDIRF